MSNELKRCAILGTAPSWRQCPWHDQGLELFGLNDAWVLGYPRVNRWFDLHPFSAFVYYDKTKPIDPRTIPAGTYLRPQGHLEWIAAQKIPVFLQQARTEWRHTVTFPYDEVLAFWSKFWPWRIDRRFTVEPGKDYEISSPAWMLMWAVMEGYTEIHIYGIHLATEWEYVKQRPNLEFLIGVASGLGVRVVLPSTVPICKGGFRYGYEAKDDASFEHAQHQAGWIQQDIQQLSSRAGKIPWYRPGERATVKRRLDHLRIELLDAQQQAQRLKAKVA